MRSYKKRLGFTLVELMIAMVLGLVLLGGVLGIFLSNQTTNRVNNELASLQSSARLAFQLMSQDIKSAGFSGCNNSSRVVSIITGAPAWSQWQGGLEGFAAGTNGLSESLRLMYGAGESVSVSTHVPPVINTNASSTLNANDIAMICDDIQTSIFQVSTVTATTVSHAMGPALSCSADLGYQSPLVCADPRPRIFPSDSMLMRFESVLWLVAESTDDPTISSLYRQAIIAGNVVTEEVLFGVSSIRFAYQDGDLPFGPANFSAAVQMGNVTGVQVTLVMDANAYANANLPLEMRTIEFFASVRNRLR
ncbi:PilW family protein [Rheinheimera sp. MMS21-TC3]|uniref:PilW family protein n=1 Tax=Rheinheimera sp. MMS21-TC3 TaxID=3072790 RepID=UPI0028C4F48B|nr:prepilin-type N-terminal cleavage/methylation domain-containing protein [Rheinheimera sp. MMS21-TC3]WNO59995.1 prepilin-type N-terminal cleavage/methylation domain-containing protein [Rheinheimera sp. MMS21-TC3]